MSMKAAGAASEFWRNPQWKSPFHDRIEALALSDLIAVMRAGKIIEIGDPKRIYFHSDHKFVADFIGRANLIKGKVSEQQGDHAVFSSEIGSIVALKARASQQGRTPCSASVLNLSSWLRSRSHMGTMSSKARWRP